MQRFDNKQTEALLAVLDHGSFERAAQELCLTPSAVSQRVRALEAQLGMPLVERTRPCRPTASGRALLQYLRRSKLLAEEFASTFADSEAFIHAPIATNHDSLETWLLPALAPVATAEKVLLQLNVDDQEFTHQKLLDGSVVAAISSKDTPMKGCEAKPLGTVRYRLMASPAFRQSYFSQGLTHATLRLAPLVLAAHGRLSPQLLHAAALEQGGMHVSTSAFYNTLSTLTAAGLLPSARVMHAAPTPAFVSVQE